MGSEDERSEKEPHSPPKSWYAGFWLKLALLVFGQAMPLLGYMHIYIQRTESRLTKLETNQDMLMRIIVREFAEDEIPAW